MPLLFLRLTSAEGQAQIKNRIPTQNMVLRQVRVVSDPAHASDIMFFEAEFLDSNGVHSNQNIDGIPLFHKIGEADTTYECAIPVKINKSIPQIFNYKITGIANPAHFTSVDLCFSYGTHALG